MSFNVSTRLNNLSLQVQQLTASSVANPLTSNLNCASYNIINCDNITAPSGMPMTLDAGNSNVVVSSNLQLNNTLNVINSSANNSLVVADSSGGDTTSFVVDASGNVGVKVNPATALTSDFTVNGGVSVSGDISCNNINASNVVNSISVGSSGLSISGPAQSPTINNTGVTSAVAGTGIGVSSGTGAVTISNTGVTSAVAGTGIGISSGTGAVTISNTGVTQLTAGSGITLSGGTGNVTISAPATGTVTSVTSDNLYIGVDNSNPATPVLQWNGIQTLTAGSSISIGGGISPIISWTGPAGYFNVLYKNVADNNTSANNIYLTQAGQYAIVANPETGGTDLNVKVYLSFGNGPSLGIADSDLGHYVIVNGNQIGNNNITFVQVYVKYGGTDYFGGNYQLSPRSAFVFDCYPIPGTTNRITFFNAQTINNAYFNY